MPGRTPQVKSRPPTPCTRQTVLGSDPAVRSRAPNPRAPSRQSWGVTPESGPDSYPLHPADILGGPESGAGRPPPARQNSWASPGPAGWEQPPEPHRPARFLRGLQGVLTVSACHMCGETGPGEPRYVGGSTGEQGCWPLCPGPGRMPLRREARRRAGAPAGPRPLHHAVACRLCLLSPPRPPALSSGWG